MTHKIRARGGSVVVEVLFIYREALFQPIIYRDVQGSAIVKLYICRAASF